ncbi:transposase [Bradyrhizobium sp. USDA 4454]
MVETGRRRRWSEDEKLRIVLESLQAPRQVTATARRYGISRSLLLRGRQLFRPERLTAGRLRSSLRPGLGCGLRVRSMRPRGRPRSRRWLMGSGDDPHCVGRAGVDCDRPH